MNQGQVGLFRSPCRCLSRLVSRLTGLSRSDLVPLRRVGLAVPAEVADGLTGERLHGEEDKLAVVEAQGVRRDQQLTDSIPAGSQQEHWQVATERAERLWATAVTTGAAGPACTAIIISEQQAQ